MERPMIISILLFGVTSVLAQSTATVWFPGVEDPLDIVGSVLGSDPTATTYTFACPSTVDVDDCPLPTPFTYTAGPSTVAYTNIYDPNYYDLYTSDIDTASLETEIWTCKITSSHTGVCVDSTTGLNNNGVSTMTLLGEELGLMAVTLTSDWAAVTGQTTDIFTEPTGFPSQVTKTVVSTQTVSATENESKSLSSGIGIGTGTAIPTGGLSNSGTTTVTTVVPPSKSQNGVAVATSGPWIGLAAVGAVAWVML